MASRDEHEWKTYLADPRFERYLTACKRFDPIGIERALCADEKSRSFDFRRVIIDAYVELQDRCDPRLSAIVTASGKA